MTYWISHIHRLYIINIQKTYTQIEHKECDYVWTALTAVENESRERESEKKCWQFLGACQCSFIFFSCCLFPNSEFRLDMCALDMLAKISTRYNLLCKIIVNWKGCVLCTYMRLAYVALMKPCLFSLPFHSHCWWPNTYYFDLFGQSKLFSFSLSLSHTHKLCNELSNNA